MRGPRRSGLASGLSWIEAYDPESVGSPRLEQSRQARRHRADGPAERRRRPWRRDSRRTGPRRHRRGRGCRPRRRSTRRRRGCCAGLDRPQRGRPVWSSPAGRPGRRGARRPAPYCARWGSTPARCHSHEGMAAHCSAVGKTRMPAGAGPGAGSPNRMLSRRQAAKASRPTTFCSITAAIRASRTRPVRGTRRPGMAADRVGEDRMIGPKSCRVVLGPDRARPGRRAARQRLVPTPPPAPAWARAVSGRT